MTSLHYKSNAGYGLTTHGEPSGFNLVCLCLGICLTCSADFNIKGIDKIGCNCQEIPDDIPHTPLYLCLFRHVSRPCQSRSLLGPFQYQQ